MKDVELKEGVDYKRTDVKPNPGEVEVLVEGDKYILIRLVSDERTEISLHGVSVANLIMARAFITKAIEEEVRKGLKEIIDGVGA
jgi:hypothetical protein